MYYGPPKGCPGMGGPRGGLPRSPAACCVARSSDIQMNIDPSIHPSGRVLAFKSDKKKPCSCKKRDQEHPERAEGSVGHQHLEPRPPLNYRSMQQAQNDYERESVPRVQFGEENSLERSGDHQQVRRHGSPLLTPPPIGTRGMRRSPSPIPFDYSLELSAHESSLESLVERKFMLHAAANPCSPCISPRAQRSKVTMVAPPVIMTDEGPVPATERFTVQRSVERYPDRDVINRRMVETKTDDYITASQIQIDFQDVQPGGLNASGRGETLHEVISATDTITIGPDISARSSETVYEYMKPTGYPMDPAQVLEMIEEESKEVEQMKHLQPPELKGSNVEDYGLKKRLQKMKLNRESVRRLESSVINPPPSADEPQEELQPELMAAIMHTEERGLTMDSTPANVYNYLFPEVKDDIVIRISPVAPSPLENIVVPVEVPASLHNSSITREMQFAAANTQCTQGALPVDNIYAKSVLKPGIAPRFNNTAVQGKKIRTREMALDSEEPPWGVEDLQPLITLVGASPCNAMPTQDISDMQSPSIYHNELENSFEYQLIPEAPRHVSRVQLRGTQKPSWFPGYFIALPDSIKLARSPSEVLPAAWQAVQPDIFADDSFLVVG